MTAAVFLPARIQWCSPGRDMSANTSLLTRRAHRFAADGRVHIRKNATKCGQCCVLYLWRNVHMCRKFLLRRCEKRVINPAAHSFESNYTVPVSPVRFPPLFRNIRAAHRIDACRELHVLRKWQIRHRSCD